MRIVGWGSPGAGAQRGQSFDTPVIVDNQVGGTITKAA
jgi:hypothetical protein